MANAHLEAGELRAWLKYYEKQLEYQQKLRYYKRLHAIVVKRLRNFTTIAVPGAGMIVQDGLPSSLYYELVEWKQLTDKRILLEQIIHVARRLAFDYDEGGELFFKRLEQDIVPELDEYDEFLVLHYPAIVHDPVYAQGLYLKDKIRVLKVRVSSLLKKIYLRPCFDIRRQIRNLVRFMRIRSNDDDDVTNVAVDSIAFSNILIYHHGTKRNPRTLMFG